MPDIYTHIINGTESLKKISKEERCTILGNRKLYNLGCMGPDIFLYYSYLPCTKIKQVTALGKAMHNVHCGEFLAEAFRFISMTNTNKDIIDERSIYFLGYLCHYALDRTAHPFVFSRSGRYDKLDRETLKFRFSHKITELAIDFNIARLYGGQDIDKLKVYSLIDVGNSIPESVEKVYFHVLNRFFSENIKELSSNFINRSYLSYRRAWKVFYDPHKIKRNLLKPIGLDFLFHPIDPYKRDYMNEKGERWPDPCTGVTEKRNFIQIFDDSLKLSHELLDAGIGYLKGNISFDYLKKKIGNFSYLTNKDVTYETMSMAYFKPIF